MIATMRTGAIILCGGASSRMGTPKAWLKYGDECGLQRIARICREVLHPICVVSAISQSLPPLPADVRIVHDSVPNHGPLQGLADGLAALETDCDALFACSCDLPLLRAAFIRRVIDLLGDAIAAAPFIDGRWEPLAAAYSVRGVLPFARRLLEQKPHAGVHDLLDKCKARRLSREELVAVDPFLKSLENVNTPEDYERAILKLS